MLRFGLKLAVATAIIGSGVFQANALSTFWAQEYWSNLYGIEHKRMMQIMPVIHNALQKVSMAISAGIIAPDATLYRQAKDRLIGQQRKITRTFDDFKKSISGNFAYGQTALAQKLHAEIDELGILFKNFLEVFYPELLAEQAKKIGIASAPKQQASVAGPSVRDIFRRQSKPAVQQPSNQEEQTKLFFESEKPMAKVAPEIVDTSAQVKEPVLARAVFDERPALKRVDPFAKHIFLTNQTGSTLSLSYTTLLLSDIDTTMRLPKTSVQTDRGIVENRLVVPNGEMVDLGPLKNIDGNIAYKSHGSLWGLFGRRYEISKHDIESIVIKGSWHGDSYNVVLVDFGGGLVIEDHEQSRVQRYTQPEDFFPRVREALRDTAWTAFGWKTLDHFVQGRPHFVLGINKTASKDAIDEAKERLILKINSEIKDVRLKNVLLQAVERASERMLG